MDTGWVVERLRVWEERSAARRQSALRSREAREAAAGFYSPAINSSSRQSSQAAEDSDGGALKDVVQRVAAWEKLRQQRLEAAQREARATCTRPTAVHPDSRVAATSHSRGCYW